MYILILPFIIIIDFWGVQFLTCFSLLAKKVKLYGVSLLNVSESQSVNIIFTLAKFVNSQSICLFLLCPLNGLFLLNYNNQSYKKKEIHLFSHQCIANSMVSISRINFKALIFLHIKFKQKSITQHMSLLKDIKFEVFCDQVI